MSRIWVFGVMTQWRLPPLHRSVCTKSQHNSRAPDRCQGSQHIWIFGVMAKRPATAELMGDFRRFTELTVRAINTKADTRNEVATVLTSVENETGPTYQPLPQIAKQSASSSSPFLSLSLFLSLEQSILHRPIFSY